MEGTAAGPPTPARSPPSLGSLPMPQQHLLSPVGPRTPHARTHTHTYIHSRTHAPCVPLSRDGTVQPVRAVLEAGADELAAAVRDLVAARRGSAVVDADDGPTRTTDPPPEEEDEPTQAPRPLPPGPALARRTLERLPEAAGSPAMPVCIVVLDTLAVAVAVVARADPAGLLPLLHQLWPSLVRRALRACLAC
jgi:hypothetical protein